MKRWKRWRWGLAGLVYWITGSTLLLAQEVVTLVTQDFPPLHMEVEGEIKGFVVETLQSALAEVQKTIPLQVSKPRFLPWKRALEIAETQKNIIFFSISRTPEREARFHWIDTVAPYEANLYKLKRNTTLQAQSLDELKGQKWRFGVQGGNNFHELLRRHGFGQPPENSQLLEVTHNTQTIDLLYEERIDLMMQVAISFPIRLQQKGYSSTEFEKLFTLEELSSELWVVMSRQTSPALIEAFTTALKHLKDSGVPQQLLLQYTRG